jgi:PAS domain S-box-containing protein
MRDKHGNDIFVRHTGFPIKEDGKIVRIVGAITNVTDEIEYRNQLEKSEERFRLLVDTAEDFIFTLNSNGYFITVNNRGARTLGYSSDEIIGKHFLEFVDEDNKADIAIVFQEILAQTELTSFEVRFVDKFEKTLTFEINARSLKTNGEITGLIGIGRDISDRIKNEKKLKDLNAKLIEANRMISIEQDRAKQQITVLEELNGLKNEFISNVSHELRTPLASIVGFAETIVSDDDLPQDMVKEFSGIILSEGKRLARLINDILDFSNLETNKDALEKSEFDIILVLNELVDKWGKTAEEKGITFSAEIPEAQITINADKERVSNAIINLLSNAVKFTNKGGRVTLMARDFLKEVEIIVSDTGIGIPKKNISKLFQKFSKVGRTGTQIPGAGFGLAMVKQIVDLHDGLVKVSSELNKGSTFIIKLPKSSRR